VAGCKSRKKGKASLLKALGGGRKVPGRGYGNEGEKKTRFRRKPGQRRADTANCGGGDRILGEIGTNIRRKKGFRQGRGLAHPCSRRSSISGLEKKGKKKGLRSD